MRARFAAVLATLLITTSLGAHGDEKDVYLAIGGSVNNFRTDARIFNPSYVKDITITARYLPMGNVDNSDVPTKTIVIPKRSQAVYDDVVKALFPGSAILGAIRLTSHDDFVATQRIYADESLAPQNGTLGQFVGGVEPSQALRKGVLIQLKSSGVRGQKGTYRTNWGAVNPNPVVANISFKLYDRNNALAGTNNLTLQPYGVFIPTDIRSFFGQPNRDISDAWISFDSDQPIIAYSSILDNGSEDGTYIPALPDTGVEAPVPPPSTTKTVTVTAFNFDYTITPSAPLRAGDQVKFVVSASQGHHGIHISTPGGQPLLTLNDIRSEVIERTVTLPSAGTYNYFCTVFCGTGHGSMDGSFVVQP